MRAVICEQYGGPEVLELADEIPIPQPGPNGVLVRVHASSINPLDWKLRAGYMAALWKLRFPVILGADFSGVVEEVGPAITLFKPGDEVHGFKEGRVAQTFRGTYAEYAVAPESTLARKPKRLSHEEAAAMPVAAVTAWQALVDQGRIKSGSRVLIHAAAGGVGTFAVQIAKSFGAYVAGTASTRNQEFLRQLGVDLAIDYTSEKIEDKLSDYDLVLDGVGQQVWSSSLKVLKPGGRLITLSPPLPPPPSGKVRFFTTVGRSVGSATVSALLRGKRFGFITAKPRGGDLEKVNALVDAGKLRPVIGKVYPMEQIADAHRESEKGHVRGKLVIKIAEEESVAANKSSTRQLQSHEKPENSPK
jgi:NADPH:quinone reductase-like Zn-dependent oxidoreductase